jgi:hypothetical protein
MVSRDCRVGPCPPAKKVIVCRRGTATISNQLARRVRPYLCAGNGGCTRACEGPGCGASGAGTLWLSAANRRRRRSEARNDDSARHCERSEAISCIRRWGKVKSCEARRNPPALLARRAGLYIECVWPCHRFGGSCASARAGAWPRRRKAAAWPHALKRGNLGLDGPAPSPQ